MRNGLAQFNVSKVEEIAETTRKIIQSFKRNDIRKRKALASKYHKRGKERIRQILHRISKSIVQDAKENLSAIIFEDIEGLRTLYKKGNWQGKNFRARMNSVPWYEIKRQTEDVLAAMNISHRGWLRFRQSKGEAGEVMVQEPNEKSMVILKVDASKLRTPVMISLQPKT